MNKDTRITLGLALLYFINGLVNLFGPTKAFAPLVFIDSFLLGLMALVFSLLPPFKKMHLIFVLFCIHFVLQGCFMTRVFEGKKLDFANELAGIFMYLAGYGYSVFTTRKFRFLLLVPGILFIFTLVSPFLNIPPPVVFGTGIFMGMWQVYLLARPEIVQVLPVAVKRFYLLTTLAAFFYAVYKAFIFFNS